MTRHARCTIAIGLLITFAAAACGGPTPPVGTTPPPPSDGPVGERRIEITSDESVIVAGEGLEVRFRARVVDADGAVVPDAEVTWESRHPDVVHVTPDGLARSLTSLGSAVLEARHADLSRAVANVVIGQARTDTILVPSNAVRSVTATAAVLDPGVLDGTPSVGSVLVSGSRGALLARVEAIENRSGELHLRLSDASLADAFEQLSFDLSGPAVAVALPADATTSAAHQSSAGAFTCERGGSVVSVAMTGFSYQGGTAYFEPYARGDLLAGQLEIGIAGDVGFSVEVGRIDVAAGLQGQITCTAPTRPLGAQPARLRLGPLTIGAAYDYTYGVDLTLSYDGPSLSVTGPNVHAEAAFAAGLRIDGLSVTPVHHFEAGDGSRTSLGAVSTSENALSQRVELVIEPSLTFSQRLSAGVGRPEQGLQLTELRFLESSLYAGLELGMDLPPDKDERGYVGPSWAIHAGAKASLAAEVGLGDLGVFLGRFLPAWVELTIDYGSVELFDVRLYREQASRGLSEASRALVLQADEPVALTADFPAPQGDTEPALQPGDRVEFVSWRDDETDPMVIGTASLRGDRRAEYDWEPDLHEDRGRHTVVARAYARGYGEVADKPLTSEPVTVLVGELVAEVEVAFSHVSHRSGGLVSGAARGTASALVELVAHADMILSGYATTGASIDTFTIEELECGYFPDEPSFVHRPTEVTLNSVEPRRGVLVRFDLARGGVNINGPAINAAGTMRCDRYSWSTTTGIKREPGTELRSWTLAAFSGPGVASAGTIVEYDAPVELDDDGFLRWYIEPVLHPDGGGLDGLRWGGLTVTMSGTARTSTFPNQGHFWSFVYTVTLRLLETSAP